MAAILKLDTIQSHNNGLYEVVTHQFSKPECLINKLWAFWEASVTGSLLLPF